MSRHIAVLVLAPALAVQAQTPINQKVIVDNPFVRVLDIRVPPGGFEPAHTHRAGVTVALSAYDNETKAVPDGTPSRSHTDFGEIRWADPVTHEVRNVGATEQHVIRIELQPNPPAPEAGQSLPSLGPLDPVQLLKDTVRLVFENRYVRVLESRAPAGSSEPRHRHLRGVSVSLSESEVETTSFPGGAARQSNKVGDVRWLEWREHQGHNISRTESRVVIVEVK
jgi:hypothetical protein